MKGAVEGTQKPTSASLITYKIQCSRSLMSIEWNDMMLLSHDSDTWMQLS